MADLLPIKITELNPLGSVANNDIFITVDKSDTTHSSNGTTKRVTAQIFKNYIFSDFTFGSVDNLSDVSITNQEGNQLLKYDALAQKWVNWTPNYLTSIDISGESIYDLSNVAQPSGNLSGGEFLTWDGASESWIAQSVTIPSTYTLPTATASVLGGVKIGSGVNVAQDGTISVTIPPAYSLPTASTTTLGGVKVDGTSITINGNGVISYSGGVGLQSRATASETTTSVSDGTAVNLNIANVAKTYSLLKIETSTAAWVTLYIDTASRTADASRTETTDPLPGSGVIAEVITTGAATQNITPGTLGWNNDTTPTSTVYAKVVNKSGVTDSITVTLTYVALED